MKAQFIMFLLVSILQHDLCANDYLSKPHELTSETELQRALPRRIPSQS